VATLLRLLPLLPAEAHLDELLAEAKDQLRQESDYLREAGHIRQFRGLLQDQPHLILPEVVEELTTPQVLTMSFVDGQPVEQLRAADQALRDRVAGWLIDLLFQEFLSFGVVQTDPNFANYRYDPTTGRLGLLDFGATRVYPPARLAQLRALLAAAATAEAQAVEDAAQAAGYLSPDDPPPRRRAVAELFLLVGEPARHVGAYDFGQSDLTARLRDSSYALGFDQGHWRPPPADLIFLHRKLAGLFLLCARLGARVDVAGRLARYLDQAG
jgi:predicted unusual protein kinase regulating ubiquinone biosynthesis (AarF/ABC1/UbiB family)